MYDIISAPGADPRPFHFSRFFQLAEARDKIIQVKDATEAQKFRGKKALVLPGDYKFDIGLMKAFGEGKAAFLIDLSRITAAQGMRRALEMGKMRRFLEICVKYEIPFALASFAKDEFSLRNASELCSIACLLGLNPGQAKFALARLGEYLQ